MTDQAYLRTKRDAARYLAISQPTLARLIRTGLPYVRVGHLVRFRPEDLADFVERQRVHRGAEAVSVAEDAV